MKENQPLDRCCDGLRIRMAARFTSRVRIPQTTVHPVLHGDRNYLRALRAAEMAAWDAGLPLALAGPFAETIAAGDQDEMGPSLVPVQHGVTFA
jgi:hypothetical protein